MAIDATDKTPIALPLPKNWLRVRPIEKNTSTKKITHSIILTRAKRIMFHRGEVGLIPVFCWTVRRAGKRSRSRESIVSDVPSCDSVFC